MIELRIEVRQFAASMEKRLAENDYKGGWDKLDKQALFLRLMQEVVELYDALFAVECINQDIQQEAADVGNFAMMLADNENNGRYRPAKAGGR